MLERSKKRVNLTDIVSEGVKFISKTDLSAGQERKNGLRSHQPRQSSLNETSNSSDDVNMTRGTRARRPRITVFQSGYCAICSVPYNIVEDHIQSKKHQKLIGQDANYIAVNGYIHSDVGIESLLSLNGIDAIGFGNEFPKTRNRNMPRAKTSSITSETKRPSSVSPTRMDSSGRHLRSRKSVNYSYMTPPLEEDSMPEKPDLEPPKSPVRLQYKEYRELRSSTRALAKLTSPEVIEEKDVWNSGRPKRTCINRQKRISADERLVADNQAYYKVEVLSNKLRSSVSRERDLPKCVKTRQSDNEKLIVKFKKLRNSELTALNNEATNFLFPKREESSEDDDADEGDTKTSMSEENETGLSSSETEDSKPLKYAFDDEVSMDSISSEGHRQKKRRSHAEAFILDNQKYYKFETPGSRLRYHGSYLSPIPMKSNGDCVPVLEKEALEKEDLEKEVIEKEDSPVPKKELKEKIEINLDEYKFSFESVPVNQPWYQAFSRIDKGEQKYQFSSNYYWDDFVMPYQMPHIKSLDPSLCAAAHRELLDGINKFVNKEPYRESFSEQEPDAEEFAEETNIHEHPSEIDEDDNTKFSCITDNSESTIVEEPPPPSPPPQPKIEITPLIERKRLPRRRKGILLSPTSIGRNPRKSPRQHASTLAILSLIQKRKRSKNSPQLTEVSQLLEPIIEEEPIPVLLPAHTSTPTPAPKLKKPPTPVRATPKVKRKDYLAIAEKIEEELDTAADCELDLEVDTDIRDSFLKFKNSKLNVSDILTIFEENKRKETEISCRRFFNGTPGRKSKRKKNLTGWPKTKKRRPVKPGEENEHRTNISENLDSEDNDDDDVASNDSINKDNTRVTENETEIEETSQVTEETSRVIEEPSRVIEETSRVIDDDSDLKDRVLRNSELQPFVYVRKLDSGKLKSAIKLRNCALKNKRTSRRRRIIVSPKSPRILRKPRGKWYRER